MLRFLKGFFKAKHPDTTPQPEPVAPYKVETPVLIPQLSVVEEVEAAPAEKPAKPAAKKRTFKKREEGGTAKVAKIKAPAKPKATPKPKTPK